MSENGNSNTEGASFINSNQEAMQHFLNDYDFYDSLHNLGFNLDSVSGVVEYYREHFPKNSPEDFLKWWKNLSEAEKESWRA